MIPPTEGMHVRLELSSKTWCIKLEWTKTCVYSTVVQIVCRTSNRLFVGLPLCEDHYLLLARYKLSHVIKAEIPTTESSMNNSRARFSGGHRSLTNFRSYLDRNCNPLSITIGYWTAPLQQSCWKISDEGPYSRPANHQAYRTNNGRAPRERKSGCAGSRRYYSN